MVRENNVNYTLMELNFVDITRFVVENNFEWVYVPLFLYYTVKYLILTFSKH